MAASVQEFPLETEEPCTTTAHAHNLKRSTGKYSHGRMGRHWMVPHVHIGWAA